MASKDSVNIYMKVKKGAADFVEELHCPMVIEVMRDKGTMFAFCMKAEISDRTFYRWCHTYDIFHECYRIGCMMSRQAWEEEGEAAQGNPEFNLELWKTQGAARFGAGKTNRVRVHIDADTNPYGQYKQLMQQASAGDFTAAEVKQLMESINVGTRVYEAFELQKAVDEMKNDLTKMSVNHGNNIVSITPIAKAN